MIVLKTFNWLVFFVFLMIGQGCQSKSRKSESIVRNEIDPSFTTKDIVIINIEDYPSSELVAIIDKILVDSPMVLGLNFYFDTTIIKPVAKNVIALESVIPYAFADGYLLKNSELTEQNQSTVKEYNSVFTIKNKAVDSFADQVIYLVNPSKNTANRNIKYKGNFEAFKLMDIPYVLSNKVSFRDKIVLMGYIGVISPDPVLLDKIDTDVYPTPIGLMYETVIQANIISTILELEVMPNE